MKEKELPTNFWKNMISDIRKYIGPFYIRFYGDEPFCRKDLLELVDFCSKRDIITSITTNGTLIDEKITVNLGIETESKNTAKWLKQDISNSCLKII